MKEFVFPAPCDPKTLRDRIEQRVREARERESVRRANKEPWAKLKLKWRTELEFDFRWIKREPFHDNSGAWAEAGPDGASLGGGIWYEATSAFSETFRGRLEPDGQGGSVLRGRFRAWGWSSWFLIGFGLLCAAFAIGLRVPLSGLGVPLAAVSLLWHLRHQDSYPASRTILAFLEDVTRELRTETAPM